MDIAEEYNAKLKEYAQSFADGAGKKVEDAYFQVEAWEHALLDHEEQNPTRHSAFLANSKESQEWGVERQGIQEALTKSRTKHEYAKEVMREGESHPEAIKHARECIEAEHPDLHSEYQKIAESERGNAPERPGAIKNYIDTVDVYKAAYIAMTQHKHDNSNGLVDSYTKALEEHKKSKPDWVQNVFSLGKAGKEWKEEQSKLSCNLENAKRDTAESKSVLDAGINHPKAREFARETVESQHPEIHGRYQREIKFQKQAAQEERSRELHERMASIQTPVRESKSVEQAR